MIIENKPHSQVLVRVDSSIRVTMRNRRFVKPLDPELMKFVMFVTMTTQDIWILKTK